MNAIRRELAGDVLGFALVALVCWQLLYLRVGEDGLSSPAETVRAVAGLLATSTFWFNAEATALAFLGAAAIAIVGGLAIGLTLGLSPLAAEVADPIVNALSALPKITLYPVILLVFGLGPAAKIAFGAIHGIFPVLILTMNGMRTVPPVIRKTALTMRLTRAQTIRTILLPAAFPEIASGIRIGVGLALLGTLVGELFSADRGIGAVLMRDVQNQNVGGITAVTLLLFVVAVSLGLGLLALERRFCRRG